MTLGDITRRGLAVAATAALAALVAAAPPKPASANQDTMVIAIGALPQGIDLDKHVSPQTWSMGAQVLEDGMNWESIDFPFSTGDAWDPSTIPGFMYPDYMGQKTLVPGIMEKCEMDEDGLRAVYHLRKGVISPWGNEFTADDVLWADRARQGHASNQQLPRVPAQHAGPDHRPAGERRLRQDRRLYGRAHLVEAHAARLQGADQLLQRLARLDRDHEERHGGRPWGDKWVATNGGGFGGYRVTEWTAGKRVVMEANENYWRGAPEIKRIIYLVVPESANRVALLKQSKVHMAEGLSPDEIVALADDANARGVAVRGNQSMWIMINNTLPPYDNVKVRQAMNHLINQEAIIRDIYHGMMNRWQGVMPSTYPGYEQHLKYDFNPEKAKALLAEAGFPDGFDAELSFDAAVSAMESIGVLLQSDFRKAGINLSLRKLPTAANSDNVMGKQGSLALWTDMPIQPDVNYALKLVWPTNALVNYHNFSDPKVDQVLQDGQGVVDPEARIAAHAGIQEHIHDLAPLGWIGEHYFAVGLSRKVSNFRWYTTQYYHVAEMSIAD